MGCPGDTSGKESVCQCRRPKRHGFSPWEEDPLEEEMATHSSILAWKIPWTKEPDGLQSRGSQRIIHDWANIQNYILLWPGIWLLFINVPIMWGKSALILFIGYLSIYLSNLCVSVCIYKCVCLCIYIFIYVLNWALHLYYSNILIRFFGMASYHSYTTHAFFFLPTHAFRLFSFCYLPRKFFFLMYLIAILLVT